MRVLVVEDEIKMAALIRRGLTEEGMAVDVADRGEDALWMAGSTEYDAIVLDVMLPGIDGFETTAAGCARTASGPRCSCSPPVTRVEDRVAGLDGGADDYLTKPFSFAELLARLRALVRRGPVERPAVVEVGDLRLDPATHQVWRGETEISLSAKEFALLEAFMRRSGEVLSRFQLLEHAWDVRVREPLQRRRRLRALPAREDRPPLRRRQHRDRPRRRVPDAKGRRS